MHSSQASNHHPSCVLQILIQLKRFNQTAQQALSRSRSIKMPGSGGSSSSSSSRAKTRPASGSPLEQDLGSILGTPDSETAGVDTSVGGEWPVRLVCG
jgi:hypothetical protein